MNKLDLIYIYAEKNTHPITAKYMFFSSVYGAFSKYTIHWVTKQVLTKFKGRNLNKCRYYIYGLEDPVW